MSYICSVINTHDNIIYKFNRWQYITLDTGNWKSINYFYIYYISDVSCTIKKRAERFCCLITTRGAKCLVLHRKDGVTLKLCLYRGVVLSQDQSVLLGVFCFGK